MISRECVRKMNESHANGALDVLNGRGESGEQRAESNMQRRNYSVRIGVCILRLVFCCCVAYGSLRQDTFQ